MTVMSDSCVCDNSQEGFVMTIIQTRVLCEMKKGRGREKEGGMEGQP